MMMTEDIKTMDLRFIIKVVDAFPKKMLTLQQKHLLIVTNDGATESVKEEWRDVEIVGEIPHY